MDSLFLKAWCLLVVMVAALATTEEVAPVVAPVAVAEVPPAVKAEETAARANVPPGFAAENEAKDKTEIGGDRSDDDDENDPAGKKFFFAYGSTTTAYGVSQFTRTVPYTCFTVVNPMTCSGRRKKSSSLFRFVPKYEISSLDSALQIPAARSLQDPLLEVEDGKNAKFFFTVWSTSTSLLSITSYFTDTGATVSVSAGCSIPNYVYNGC